jgi:hypothetical protein
MGRTQVACLFFRDSVDTEVDDHRVAEIELGNLRLRSVP